MHNCSNLPVSVNNQAVNKHILILIQYKNIFQPVVLEYLEAVDVEDADDRRVFGGRIASAAAVDHMFDVECLVYFLENEREQLLVHGLFSHEQNKT